MEEICSPVISAANRSARVVLVACLAFFWAGSGDRAKADSTFVYAVQLTATAQLSPPAILLSWLPDPYGANSYTVYRKTKEATSWGAGTTLPGWAEGFTDNNVSPGVAYEYQVVKAGSLGYSGYGYVYAGLEAPLIEDRGKIILLVATNSTASLETELARLKNDLIGDGWTVSTHAVSSADAPATVRNRVINEYFADPANVKAVFLFGHVPVLMSGNLNYDGHLIRPMPADAYYGDVDGIWNNPNFLPTDVELMVGRVDLWDMPGNATPGGWPSETELLRNYLNKDHQWRHKRIAVARGALMGNRRGDEQGEATAASGYRNFDPLVGHFNTVEANIEDNAPPEQRWISLLARQNYLWAYGCGGGQVTSIGGLGTHGQYFDVWSSDLVGFDAQAVFVMFFGSYFGNWNTTDNIMRSVLATPTFGLACCMAGRPHWFFHHLGLGEPIGYSAKITMNNLSLYRNQSNGLARAIYIALMGDPTLRLDPVGPVSNLSGMATQEGVRLQWSPSSDSVAGYHVYRSLNPAGPFTRITPTLSAANEFIDRETSAGIYTYMVRAVKLQTTPSGSYFNPSQGLFVTLPTSPLRVTANLSQHALVLSWNSWPASIYQVQSTTNPVASQWIDASGPITASGNTTYWTDTSVNSGKYRFYRVLQATP
jgi:hypothetical protein